MTQGTVAPRKASAPAVAKQGRSIAISDDSVATSVALLNRDGKLWIEHGGERYLLRRTANNRLILTKQQKAPLFSLTVERQPTPAAHTLLPQEVRCDGHHSGVRQ